MTAHEAHGRGVAPRTVATFDKAMGLGDLATGSSDFRSAIQHYRNALAALGDSSGDARVSTLRKLSECLIHVGEFVEAQVAGQEAAHAIDETTSVRERARVALLRGRSRLGRKTSSPHARSRTRPCSFSRIVPPASSWDAPSISKGPSPTVRAT